MTEDNFIGGDGGPMVVLQASAASQWQGASDFENSLMGGGNIETDYDIICESEEKGRLIKRYNRDMLVLADSEWGAYISALPSGAVAIVQQFKGDKGIDKIIESTTHKHPSKSFTLDIKDQSLRLLVGADDGKGDTYGYKDVAIAAGARRCDVFSSDDELVIIINPT